MRRVNVYRVTFTLDQNGELVDDILHVLASNASEAIAQAEAGKLTLRRTAVFKVLTVRDVILEIEDIYLPNALKRAGGWGGEAT